MRKLIATLLFMILLLIPHIGQAQVSGEESVGQVWFNDVLVDYVPIEKTIKLNPFTEINILQDGRVEPVKNVKSLMEGQIDYILQQMNYSIEDLKSIPLELKREYASQGGLLVDSEMGEIEFQYESLDGTVYKANENNIDEINEVRKQDAETLGISLNEFESEISIQSMSNCGPGTSRCNQSDGIWSGYSEIIYVGTSGSNYVYGVRLRGTYSSLPNFTYTDRMAISSDVHHNLNSFNTAAHCYTLSGGGTSCFEDPIRRVDSTVQGVEWRKVLRNQSNQYIHGTQYFNISQSRSGITYTFVLGYMHQWTSMNREITIQNAKLTFPSVPGDKWSWSHRYTVR